MRIHFSVTMLLVPAMLFSSALRAEPADEIQRLADTGAVNLALRVLDREQAGAEKQVEVWETYERQRIALYRTRHDWQHASERLAEMPKFVSAGFIQWGKTQRADALINMGEGEAARKELRLLIWQDQTHDPAQLSEWRRLIIRSYLGDGLAVDAQTAALRFRQDYSDIAEQDYMLRARILLLNRNYDEAIELLKPHAEEPTAGALLLLAQLRGQARSSNKVLQASYRHLRSKDIDEEMQANLWAVAAEAAQAAGNRGSATTALEQVVVFRKSLSLPKAVIDPGSDDLWNAYIDYAMEISNKEQILIGQDDKWMALAEKIKKKQPVGARSLYAFVMLRGQQAEIRNKAANEFVDVMSERKQGNRLLQSLFNEGKYFKQRSDIPEPIRHKLVDLALASANIDLASEIMATIKEPPPGQDQFMWQLRRARILVLGNQLKLGAQALDTLLEKNPALEQIQTDRFMQVVFDLQTAGENEPAYNLFAKLMTRTKDEKIQREIYFWMADSRKAQERYDEAAQLYLKSAMYPDPASMDDWAQTAHYQAADVLAKAGMYQDAQILFERLLNVTNDPPRRAALKRELQKLWAMQ